MKIELVYGVVTIVLGSFVLAVATLFSTVQDNAISIKTTDIQVERNRLKSNESEKFILILQEYNKHKETK